MNVTSEKLKNRKIKWSNHQKWFSFIVESCEHFRSFGDHESMIAESAIEKL
jgi:hypothetical protein